MISWGNRNYFCMCDLAICTEFIFNVLKAHSIPTYNVAISCVFLEHSIQGHIPEHCEMPSCVPSEMKNSRTLVPRQASEPAVKSSTDRSVGLRTWSQPLGWLNCKYKGSRAPGPGGASMAVSLAWWQSHHFLPSCWFLNIASRYSPHGHTVPTTAFLQ
jgi:hypothetical protein